MERVNAYCLACKERSTTPQGRGNACTWRSRKGRTINGKSCARAWNTCLFAGHRPLEVITGAGEPAGGKEMLLCLPPCTGMRITLPSRVTDSNRQEGTAQAPGVAVSLPPGLLRPANASLTTE